MLGYSWVTMVPSKSTAIIAMVLFLYGVIVRVAIVAVAVIAVRTIGAIVSIMSVVSILAVFAVLAIAVTEAVLVERHVYTIDDDGDIGQLAVLGQLVDHEDIFFRRIVGTGDIGRDVATREMWSVSVTRPTGAVSTRI